jgi:hypothetical protein
MTVASPLLAHVISPRLCAEWDRIEIDPKALITDKNGAALADGFGGRRFAHAFGSPAARNHDRETLGDPAWRPVLEPSFWLLFGLSKSCSWYNCA